MGVLTLDVQGVFDRVRRTFGDEGSVQITDADLFRWINDAQLQISRDNPGMMEAIGTADVTEKVAEYPLPDDANVLRSLSYKGFRLRALSFAEFNEYLDGFDAQDNSKPYGPGVPAVFMVYANTITLFPTPNENVAAGLKIYYSRHPVQITTVADPLTVPERYHTSIVDYVLQQAYELDEDFDKAQYKKGAYDEGIMKVANQEKWTSREYYPTITTLPEDGNYGDFGFWGGIL